MRALVLSHAHPTYSIGGAQVASYSLFTGLKELEGWPGSGRPSPGTVRRR